MHLLYVCQRQTGTSVTLYSVRGRLTAIGLSYIQEHGFCSWQRGDDLATSR